MTISLFISTKLFIIGVNSVTYKSIHTKELLAINLISLHHFAVIGFGIREFGSAYNVILFSSSNIIHYISIVVVFALSLI